MAFYLRDRVREISTSTGTGNMALLGAPNGYQSFANVILALGDTFWYAIVQPGGGWETGIGAYNATNTLTRTTVFESSNAGSLVSFPVGSKDVFMCQPAFHAQPFPSGTLMLFQQTSAPVYWTKQTGHNDKALRVTSGTTGAGGANPFLSCFQTNYTVSSTTITNSTAPNHLHTANAPVGTIGACQDHVVVNVSNVNGSFNTSLSGQGDQSHNHGFTINVQYVDIIIAMKD